MRPASLESSRRGGTAFLPWSSAAGLPISDDHNKHWRPQTQNLFLFILSLHDGLHGCLDDRSGHRPHTQPNLVQIVAAFFNTSFAIQHLVRNRCRAALHGTLTGDGHDADGSQNITFQGEPDRKTGGLATWAQDGSTQRGSSGWGRSARQAWSAKPRVLGHGSKVCTVQLGHAGNDGNTQPQPWGTKSEVFSTPGLKMALALPGRACVEAMSGMPWPLTITWHAAGGCRGKVVASGVPLAVCK